MAAVNWSTVSALATGFGTLVLALATFAAVRSANRSARVAERSLLAGLRPLLISGRVDDGRQRVAFSDDFAVVVEGDRAALEVTDDAIYLVMPVRNVGTGIAILDRWAIHPERLMGADEHPDDPDTFRRLTRDIYVAAGDLGFWQGAFRDAADPAAPAVRRAIVERRPLTLDLLYADHEGGQRTISRFLLAPVDKPDGQQVWVSSIGRHWNLDRRDPR